MLRTQCVKLRLALCLVLPGVHLGEACTIVLRGASSHILDEADRSLHDALCVLTETVKDARVVYGGGWPEMRMARAIEELAAKTPGEEHHQAAWLLGCVVIRFCCTNCCFEVQASIKFCMVCWFGAAVVGVVLKVYTLLFKDCTFISSTDGEVLVSVHIARLQSSQQCSVSIHRVMLHLLVLPLISPHR